MPVATIAEAAAGLQKLVDAALAGEDVVITRDGVPVVRLEQISEAATPSKSRFAANFGRWAGRGEAPDWTDWKNSDAEIEAEFAASDIGTR